MNPVTIRKTLIASSIALALSAPCAQAALVTNVYGAFDWSTDSANFTMLNSAGGYSMGPDGGENNVLMFWDGNGYSASSDYTGPGGPSNVTASTSDQFFGGTWAAHDIQVFVPGTYAFDTTLGGGNSEAGILNVTVNPGQLGMHLLWDWGGSINMDIVVVFDGNSVFGAGIGRGEPISAFGTATNRCDNANVTNPIKNCLFDGKPYGTDGKPLGSKVWMLASVDGNGDGIMGIPMAPGGPFAGFNANFNANMASTPDTVVPVPAAVWLFGSGLLGLVGAAHRRKKMV